MQAKDKALLVEEVFDTIAPRYDWMNLVMTWGMLPIWQNRVMAATETKPGDRALDVCCGSGEMTLALAKRCGPFGGAMGLDFSDDMLDVAKDKARGFDQGQVAFVQGDALDLPFPNHAFAATTQGFALRNVVDVPLSIAEMARVVRPGGKVVILEVSRPTFPLTRAFFDIYYFKLVPLLGDRLVSGQAIQGEMSPYRWLAESLRDFPDRATIVSYMEEAGLVDVKARPMGFGAVTLYEGTKAGALEAEEDIPLQKRNPLEEAIFQVRKRI